MNSTQFRRPTRIAALLAVTMACAPIVSMAQEPSQPVMVGGIPDLDACGSQGEVTSLDPNGDNFLAVRAGPGSDNAEIDRLDGGQVVNMCTQEGRWIGIVYAPGATMEGGGIDCGVGTPIDPAEPYVGPCRSGWVFEDYVTLFAG